MEYRCRFLDERGHIQSEVDFEAGGIDDAVDRGISLLDAGPDRCSIELWDGPLRIYSSLEHPPRHQCHVYHGAPSVTLQTMAAMVAQRLKANLRCLYFNSPTMIAGLRSYLAAQGVDVEAEVEKGALVLSPEQAHSDGKFDAASMLADLERAIEGALADGHRGLWASGDMAWELGPECDPEELLVYERGLEEVFRRQPAFSGVCQYHADTLPRELVECGLSVHRSLLVNETLSRLNPYYRGPNDARPAAAGFEAMVEGVYRGA